MINAKKLHERDQKHCKDLDWSSMAFISPELPEPKTDAEQEVRILFFKMFGTTTYKLHIYDVLEAMERAHALGYQMGIEPPT